MKTNTIKQITSRVSNTQNFKTESETVELQPVTVPNQELFSECTYGLEYILDELFPEGRINENRQLVMNWAGFDDLTI